MAQSVMGGTPLRRSISIMDRGRPTCVVETLPRSLSLGTMSPDQPRAASHGPFRDDVLALSSSPEMPSFSRSNTRDEEKVLAMTSTNPVPVIDIASEPKHPAILSSTIALDLDDSSTKFEASIPPRDLFMANPNLHAESVPMHHHHQQQPSMQTQPALLSRRKSKPRPHFQHSNLSSICETTSSLRPPELSTSSSTSTTSSSSSSSLVSLRAPRQQFQAPEPSPTATLHSAQLPSKHHHHHHHKHSQPRPQRRSQHPYAYAHDVYQPLSPSHLHIGANNLEIEAYHLDASQLILYNTEEEEDDFYHTPLPNDDKVFKAKFSDYFDHRAVAWKAGRWMRKRVGRGGA